MALSPKINSSESLGRYLTQKNHFSRMRNEVKPNAFFPPPNLQLSVYRIDGLTLDEIWKIGKENVVDSMAEPRNLYGIADVKARVVEEEKLTIMPDNLPSRHANILDWPSEEARWLSITQRIAAEAKLILKSK